MRRPFLAATVVAATATFAFTPAGSSPAAPTGASAVAPGAPGWVELALADGVDEDDLQALDDIGVGDRAVLDGTSFAAFIDGATAARADELAGVDVGELEPADKVSSALEGRVGSVRVDVLTAAPATAALSDAILLEGRGIVRGATPVHADGTLTVIRADVRADVIDDLAARRDVLAIGPGPTAPEAEDEMSNQIMANALEDNLPVVGYRDFLAGLELDGSGVTVAITDDGLDPTHPDLSGRIVERYSYGPENDVVPAQGHGTHVAGIVGGLGADIGPLGPLTDADGFSYGLGVAPGVSFVDQPIIQLATSATAFREVGFPQLVADARAAGAALWNASWTDGGGAGAGYVANAATLDGLTRDAAPEEEGEQPFTFVFSAGNSGSGETTITSPKEAKNVIVVGSSVNARAGDPRMVSSFSSRGPARDGRILPTIVAPGETIISARAATGVLCSVPLSGLSDAAPADGLSLYTGCSGTSMASPHAAGAVALLHQWWDRTFGGAPSPAMAKGTLVNNARDLRRSDVPNRDEGWGMIDLEAMFDPAVARVLEDQATALAATEEHVLEVEVTDVDQPLRVTLAWTDAPGTPGRDERALVNDLDLEVVAPDGTLYLGNVFDDGGSVTGGSRDDLNNLENVWVAAPQAGTWTVRVRATDVLSDGVLRTETVDQDFALLVRNATSSGGSF